MLATSEAPVMDRTAPVCEGTWMVVFDAKELGKRLRGARLTAGYESIDAVNRQLQERYLVTYSSRGLLAIERGGQMPTLDQFLTLVFLYDPPGGIEFFLGAIRPEHVLDFQRIFLRR